MLHNFSSIAQRKEIQAIFGLKSKEKIVVNFTWD